MGSLYSSLSSRAHPTYNTLYLSSLQGLKAMRLLCRSVTPRITLNHSGAEANQLSILQVP